MTGHELRAARYRLGRMWGLGRPLTMAALGRILRLQGADPGATVRDWERRDGPTGPAGLAVELMLAGAKPKSAERLATPFKEEEE
jgi:hypothetical protein